MRYHVNPQGEVGSCRAVKSCPFGDMVTDHYGSVPAARKAYEGKQASHLLPKAPKRWRAGAVAGVLTFTLSVSACVAPSLAPGERTPNRQVGVEGVQEDSQVRPEVQEGPQEGSASARQAEEVRKKVEEALRKLDAQVESTVKQTSWGQEDFPHDTSASSPSAQEALKILSELQVKGRAPLTGYERDKVFGDAWQDVDGNGCDTRNDILQRDLRDKTFKDSKGCVVTSGRLDDPYTGKTLDFIRGKNTSAAVQIDHRVPLADAWQKGAQQWSQSKRVQFANDPLNLQATDGPTNASKGAGDAATWLPPNKSYRCAYVATQVQVKQKYGLWVTSAEQGAIQAILVKC